MMRPANDLDTVWLARDPVDFRKGINGLSILVEDQLSSDPFSGQLFVFTNKKRSFTSFNIPIAVCGDRVSLASAAWQAIAGHQAIWAAGRRDDRCRGQARVEPRVARMDVLCFGLRVNERGPTSACNRCAE
jgi:hypothetical protein